MILDAEGVEICVGDIVCNVDTGIEYRVARLPKPGEYFAVSLAMKDGDGICNAYDPDRLTHKKTRSN